MASNPKEKKPKTTLEKYKLWRNWDYGLTAAKFAMPLVPFGVVLGLNWNDWVGDSASEGWSLGLGFGMLIVATVSAIIGIWKKDKLVNEKFSGVFYVAIVLAVIGFSFKLLATMINEMGNMFLYVSTGVIGSGIVDEVDKLAVVPKRAYYKELVEKNGLDKSSAKKIDEAEQAQREGEQAKKERMKRATE